MEEYNPIQIEKKWREEWERTNRWKVSMKDAKKPFYNLMMFPYPSAEGLHIGNVYAFTAADIYGRFQRMQGNDVFEPIGFDAFGIHSENFAIKKGIHPSVLTERNVNHFREQLKQMGALFDWDHEVNTSAPEYYKWTQWLFVQLYKNGLAYRKSEDVDWCVSCKTVLAHEQVIAGKCERCGTVVVQKKLEQWFLKITAYAEQLLKNLDVIDWTESVKSMQRNWIGRSEGAELSFPVQEDANFVFIHGFKGSTGRDFFPWLKESLEVRGHDVYAPDLPNAFEPNIEEQVEFLLKNASFNEDTVIITHSLGGVVAMKLLPRLKMKIKRLVMVAPPLKTEFVDGKTRVPLEKATDWKFDFPGVADKANEIVVIQDIHDNVVPHQQTEEIAKNLHAKLQKVLAPVSHFHSDEVPEILQEAAPSIKVFTTRPDTLSGATYLVLAPDHDLVDSLSARIQNFDEVLRYRNETQKKTEIERMEIEKDKTGIELKGIKAIHPATKKSIPIWIADYVLRGYGTGAIMAVPAHDQRDFEFAKKFGLPIVQVVCQNYPKTICPVLDNAYTGPGVLVASGEFDGMENEDAKKKITESIGGEMKTQYRLRDWLISRQRYWGPPIPIIYCRSCWEKKRAEGKEMRPGIDYTTIDEKEYAIIPVPEEDLPVELPYVENFQPTGTALSPLASVESFVHVVCPECGSAARRETDVSDSFLDSSWYFLRYPSSGDKNEAFRRDVTEKWLPVNMYIGGKEHSVLHLLYARFVTMALHDMKFVDFDEPFSTFRGHGLLIKDGAKMSKSRGNVVNPDEYFASYGVDATRMFLMFIAPVEEGGDWRDAGIAGIARFLKRVWTLQSLQGKLSGKTEEVKGLERLRHKTIKKVTQDIATLQYNTAISALMEYINEMPKTPIDPIFADTLLVLLAPLAPHLCEELWQQRGHKGSVHDEHWPEYDEMKLQEDSVEIPVQVNGKIRGRILLPADSSEEQIQERAMQNEKIAEILEGKKIIKWIIVPQKLVNILVEE